MDKEKDKLLTAAEYSAKKGKSKSWGARLAQMAIEAGKPYPKRFGNYWVATFEEWEKALDSSGIELRDRKSYRREDQ